MCKERKTELACGVILSRSPPLHSWATTSPYGTSGNLQEVLLLQTLSITENCHNTLFISTWHLISCQGVVIKICNLSIFGVNEVIKIYILFKIMEMSTNDAP